MARMLSRKGTMSHPFEWMAVPLLCALLLCHARHVDGLSTSPFLPMPTRQFNVARHSGLGHYSSAFWYANSALSSSNDSEMSEALSSCLGSEMSEASGNGVNSIDGKGYGCHDLTITQGGHDKKGFPTLANNEGVLRRAATWMSTYCRCTNPHGPQRVDHATVSDGDKELQEAHTATTIGLAKNVVLTVGKAVIGISANSQALLADAAHSLADIGADLVAMVTLRIARLPADREHPYGYGKFEPIGAVGISSLLVWAGGSLAWSSINLVKETLASHVAPAVPSIGALWLSLAAVALNEALFRITLRAGSQAKSQTVIANAWHHRSDALSSVVAMIGISLAMAGFPLLDPIAGGCVGLMIARTGGEMIMESFKDLIDASDADVMCSVEKLLSEMADVVACKSVRHRRMGPAQIVEAHISVLPHLTLSDVEQVLAEARSDIQQQIPDITEVVLRASPSDTSITSE